jgi:uncharacterized membrane protein YccC
VSNRIIAIGGSVLIVAILAHTIYTQPRILLIVLAAVLAGTAGIGFFMAVVWLCQRLMPWRSDDGSDEATYWRTHSDEADAAQPQPVAAPVRERIERGTPIMPANRWQALELSRWQALPPLPGNGHPYTPVDDEELMEW